MTEAVPNGGQRAPSAEFCPECANAGVVATVNGPTCKHSSFSGSAWFPHDWAKMTEMERVKWLSKKRILK